MTCTKQENRNYPFTPIIPSEFRNGNKHIIGYNYKDKRDVPTPSFPRDDEIAEGFPSDVDLYSCWGYRLRVFSSDAQMGNVSKSREWCPVNSEQTVTAIPNDGYEFVEWSNGATTEDHKVLMTENYELTATFTPSGFGDIYFYSNTPEETKKTQKIVLNAETVLESNEFEKTGMYFHSWNVNRKGFGSSFVDNDTVQFFAIKNYLYAQWGYKLETSVQDEKGYVEGVENNGIYLPNTNAVITMVPNEGYQFSKWDNGSTNNPITVKMDGNKQITGVCSPIEYTISYNLDGGENHPDNPTTYTIESPTITLEIPTRSDYVFDHWELNGNTITTIPQGSFGDITLLAVWKAKEYWINVSTSSSRSFSTPLNGAAYFYGNSSYVSSKLYLTNSINGVSLNAGNNNGKYVGQISNNSFYVGLYYAPSESTGCCNTPSYYGSITGDVVIYG